VRVKKVLPDSLYKKLGGYTPSFFELNRKLDLIQASVLMVIIDKMKEPGVYVEIKTEHIAKNLGLSWRRVHPVLQKLRDKGLINIKEGGGGKYATKFYRADLLVLGDLFDIPEEDFTNRGTLDKTLKYPQQNVEVPSTKPRTKQSLQLSVKGRKDTPTSYPEISEREETPWDKRARIWARHLEIYDPTFLKSLVEYTRENTTNGHLAAQLQADDQTLRYVTYFVLSEQWMRNRRQCIPKDTPEFLDFMYAILGNRWAKTHHMWEYDQMAAQIADQVGVFRDVGLSAIAQYKEANRFSRLYGALGMSARGPEVVDLHVHSYLRFLEDYVSRWQGKSFKFRYCASDKTLEAYDEEHPPATGKDTIMGYFNAIC
jgi:DNA-binding transcriptional ArsR family regulator